MNDSELMYTELRFSLDGDYGSRLRNKLDKELTASGMQRRGTGFYVGRTTGGVPRFFATIARHDGPARLDHVMLLVHH